MLDLRSEVQERLLGLEFDSQLEEKRIAFAIAHLWRFAPKMGHPAGLLSRTGTPLPLYLAQSILFIADRSGLALGLLVLRLDQGAGVVAS